MWDPTFQSERGLTNARRVLPSAVLCFLGVVAPGLSPVFAQQDFSKSEREAFERHLKGGADAYRSGDFRLAVEQYEAARAINDDPQILYGIARSYQQMHHCEAASERYRALNERDDAPAELKKKAETRLAATENTCVSKGSLEITCSRPNATIEIAAKQYSCPLQTTLKTGTYRVSARAPDGWFYDTEVEVKPGEALALTFELEQQVVSPETPKDTAYPRDRSTNWLVWSSYGALAVGGGLLIGGVATDISSLRRTDALGAAIEANDQNTIDTLEQQNSKLRSRTLVLYGVGSGVLLTGVILKLAAPRKESTAYKLPSLEVAPGEVVLQKTWRW